MPSGGIAIYFKLTCTCAFGWEVHSPRIGELTVGKSTNNPVSIAVVYRTGDHAIVLERIQFYDKITNSTQLAEGRKFVIGDFNARLGEETGDKCKSRNIFIENKACPFLKKFMAHSHLLRASPTYAHTPPSTCISIDNKGSSIIDYVLYDQDQPKVAMWYDINFATKHASALVNISKAESTTWNGQSEKWISYTSNHPFWDAFRFNICIEEGNNVMISNKSISKRYQELTEALVNARTKSESVGKKARKFSTSKKQKREANNFWTNAFKAVRKILPPQEWEEAIELHHKATRSSQETSAKSAASALIQSVCSNIKSNPKIAYAAFNQSRNQKKEPLPRIVNISKTGRYTSNNQEVFND